MRKKKDTSEMDDKNEDHRRIQISVFSSKMLYFVVCALACAAFYEYYTISTRTFTLITNISLLLSRKAFLTFSFLGAFVCELFFAFHLLNIISSNQLLQRVIKALTMNGTMAMEIESCVVLFICNSRCSVCAGMSLVWVAVLCLILMYLFAIVAFMFFRDMFIPTGDSYAYCT